MSAAPKPRRKAAKAEAPRLSQHRRPSTMAPDAWQLALRGQFGREQAFELHNVGDQPVFSEFRVGNPDGASRYRVAIRGAKPGDNYCSCLDFATNDLGTCKHLEFTLARLAKRRGGKREIARGFTPAFSEVHLQYGGRRFIRFHAGTDCPTELIARARELFDPAANWSLPHDRLGALDGFVGAAARLGHELRVYDDTLEFIAQLRDADRRAQLLTQAYPKGVADKGLRTLLKARLYPYQVEGALFAARAGRALIADEMGLGKTIQAIAAAELMARHFGVQRVLVICPTSLKHQWQREIARFSDREAHVLRGLRSARETQWRDEHFCKIVNYETMARDQDLIAAWGPELLIVDEAQRVKNWNTIAARALRRIAAPYVIVLTGTPLENRLEELVAIVQLVDQYRLGPTWRLRHEHQQTDDAGRVIGYHDLDKLGATLAPVLLRRRKAEVLEQLPARVDKTLFVPLTREQRIHHDENGMIVTRIVARWRKTGYLSDTDQRRLQCALQNMRMACDSTWLLDRETDHGAKADELIVLLDELFEQPGAKAVVFSQWLGMHEVALRRVRARGWGHVLFHGGVPSDQRGALVDRFVDDPACRLFFATDAGSVGLNLQHAAATVVNLDLPWNPAVLEQRIGRVYRMGQRRGVQVVNLVGQGSIEEGILSVLAFKKSLFAGVLDGGDASVFMNGTRLSRFMQSVDAVAGGFTAGEEDDGATAAAAAGLRTPRGGVADPASASGAPVVSGTDAVAAPEARAGGDPVAPPPAGTHDAGPVSPAPMARAADPWAPLLDAGLQLIESLAGHPDAAASPWVQTDAAGQRYLKLPLPEPQALQRLADGLAGLLGALRDRQT